MHLNKITFIWQKKYVFNFIRKNKNKIKYKKCRLIKQVSRLKYQYYKNDDFFKKKICLVKENVQSTDHRQHPNVSQTLTRTTIL